MRLRLFPQTFLLSLSFVPTTPVYLTFYSHSLEVLVGKCKDMSSVSKPTKVCFVTIGATASFDALIQACFQPDFIVALAAANYTDLLVQYGRDGQRLFEELSSRQELKSIVTRGFDFNSKGLGEEMRAAKGTKEKGRESAEGVVLSHAGKLYSSDALVSNSL